MQEDNPRYSDILQQYLHFVRLEPCTPEACPEWRDNFPELEPLTRCPNYLPVIDLVILDNDCESCQKHCEGEAAVVLL